MSIYGGILRFIRGTPKRVSPSQAIEIVERHFEIDGSVRPMRVEDCGTYYFVRTRTDRSGGNAMVKVSVDSGAILEVRIATR